MQPRAAPPHTEARPAPPGFAAGRGDLTDPITGPEIVLGLEDGVAFVDASDPWAPLNLGTLGDEVDVPAREDVREALLAGHV